MEYNLKTKTFTVLADQLRMPNGLVHVPEDDAVLMADTLLASVFKFVSSEVHC